MAGNDPPRHLAVAIQLAVFVVLMIIAAIASCYSYFR